MADSAPTEPVEPEALALIATLVTANVDQLARTTDTLIDGLTKRAERAEATLAAVRGGVEALLSGRYAPTDAAILRALWPPLDTNGDPLPWRRGVE